MSYVAYALFGLSALVAVGNISGCVSAVRRKRSGEDRGFSCVPLLSMIFALGAWALGGEALGLWAFFPTAVDPGTWVVALIPVYAIIDRDDSDGPDSGAK